MWGKKRMRSAERRRRRRGGSNEEGGSALIHANARHFARQGRLTTGKAAKAPSPLVEVAQSEFKVQR